MSFFPRIEKLKENFKSRLRSRGFMTTLPRKIPPPPPSKIPFTGEIPPPPSPVNQTLKKRSGTSSGIYVSVE